LYEKLEWRATTNSPEILDKSVHMRKLEDAGVVKVHKKFVARKPRTTYRCTKKGKQEIQNYLETVEAILKKTSI